MPLLIQMCIVIVTAAIALTAAFAMRALHQMTRTARDCKQLIDATRESLSRVDRLAAESRDLVISMRTIVPNIRSVAERFEALGWRAADLSSAVLSEVEAPVMAAAAIVRGVRSGGARFLERLVNRFTHSNLRENGDTRHE